MYTVAIIKGSRTTHLPNVSWTEDFGPELVWGEIPYTTFTLYARAEAATQEVALAQLRRNLADNDHVNLFCFFDWVPNRFDLLQ